MGQTQPVDSAFSKTHQRINTHLGFQKDPNQTYDNLKSEYLNIMQSKGGQHHKKIRIEENNISSLKNQKKKIISERHTPVYNQYQFVKRPDKMKNSREMQKQMYNDI